MKEYFNTVRVEDVNLTFWYIMFFIGLVMFFCGIVFFLVKEKNKTNISISAFLELLACWILYIPNEVSKGYQNHYDCLHIIHSVLIALLKAITKFLGDGYDPIFCEGNRFITNIYSGLAIVANITMLIFAGTLVIKFINGPIQRFRLFWYKRRNFFIFYGCNEKSISIASSIPQDKPYNLIFVFDGNDVMDETRRQIDLLGGVTLCDDLCSVVCKYYKNSKGINVFLFDDEQINLDVLNKICKKIGLYKEGFISKIVNRNKKIRLYVELNKTPWGMYQNIKNEYDLPDNIVINLVRSEENFAYNNLLVNSIFDNSTEIQIDNQILKKIKIVIFGLNERNIEMLKAVLHLSQMPGYYPVIVLLDDKSRRDYLYRIMPEISDGYEKKGNAIYKFEYYGEVDFESNQFDNIYNKSLYDFTFAFINYSNDLSNINMAISLKNLCYRSNRNGDYNIQVSVRNASTCENWNKSLLSDIQIVGTNKDVFGYKHITMSDIERITEIIHRTRYKDRSWESYCNNEYNRHSVYARTLSYRYKIKHILESGQDISVINNEDPWWIYEHMRWNMYTRTLGYICPQGDLKETLDNLTREIGDLSRRIKGKNENNDSLELLKARKKELEGIRKQLREKARVHEDLVDYDSLIHEVKKQDFLEVNQEIIDAYNELDNHVNDY